MKESSAVARSVAALCAGGVLRVAIVFFVGIALCLACLSRPAFAQGEEQLTANRRLLPNIGAGLRAVKSGPDGRTYVLASPSPGLVVFDAQNKQLFLVAATT